MSHEVKVKEGSDNIFKDLGFLDDVAKDELLKAQLGVEILRILKERKLTQTETATMLGVKRTEISRLIDAKLSNYSVERLLRFLECLNCEVSIHICAP